MNILIILGHPAPTSLNHAIAQAVRDDLIAVGHDVTFHDLYAEGFDPLIEAQEIPESGPVDPQFQRHCKQLCATDGIVIVHPNWWGMPPAILKGWVDRVVRPGMAYRFDEGDSGEGVPIGLLKARAAVVLNTSNTEPAREQAVFGDPLENIWRSCIFDLCGVRNFHRQTFTPVVTSSEPQRRAWIKQAVDLCRDAFAES